ncbi:MAG: P27 family phage terminase small subunit [Acetobacteraceae bacterium]
MPRQRKPQGVKELAANDRPDRRVSVPAGRLDVAPDPPANLSKSAATEWRELAPQAVWLGTLAGSDLRAFALLCETLATEGAARAILAVQGMTVRAGDGGCKSHPASRTLEAARSQAARLLAEFGLTPRGRAALDTEPMGSAARRGAPVAASSDRDRIGAVPDDIGARIRALRVRGGADAA